MKSEGAVQVCTVVPTGCNRGSRELSDTPGVVHAHRQEWLSNGVGLPPAVLLDHHYGGVSSACVYGDGVLDTALDDIRGGTDVQDCSKNTSRISVLASHVDASLCRHWVILGIM